MPFFDYYKDYQFEFDVKTPIIVPISGGKDSQATLILALNTGCKTIPIFNDTGWEHPLTYRHLRYLEKTLSIKIVKTKGPKKNETLEQSIVTNKRFPWGTGRFCTSYLKQVATRDWYKNHIYKEGENVEIWYGLRTAESAQRKHKYSGLEPSDLFDMAEIFHDGRWNKKLRKTIKVRLPIITWTTADVFRFLKESGIKHNPLYDQGEKRVGCYPCMLSTKAIHARIFKTDFGKQQLQKIKKLEQIIGKKYEVIDTEEPCQFCKL